MDTTASYVYTRLEGTAVKTLRNFLIPYQVIIWQLSNNTDIAMVQLDYNMVNNGFKLMGLLKGTVHRYGSCAIMVISLAVK